MAYVTIPTSPANIPLVPGVPSLSAVATGLGAGPILAIANELGFDFGVPQWGIFDKSGNPVLTGDCVAELGYRRDYQISDYPVEDGGFASYNKVQRPAQFTVAFMVGGADSDRATFLNKAEAIAASLTLYSVATPEVAYPSVNVTGITYRRTSSHGATLMCVELSCEEVRIAVAAKFTNTAQPSGAAAENGGTAPTTSASDSQFISSTNQSTATTSASSNSAVSGIQNAGVTTTTPSSFNGLGANTGGTLIPGIQNLPYPS